MPVADAILAALTTPGRGGGRRIHLPGEAAGRDPGGQVLVVDRLRQPDPLHGRHRSKVPAPLPAFFDKSWRPGEVELVDGKET